MAEVLFLDEAFLEKTLDIWGAASAADLLVVARSQADDLADDAPWHAWAEAMPCPVLVLEAETEGEHTVDLLFVEEEIVEYAHPPGAVPELAAALAQELDGGAAVDQAVGAVLQTLL